MSQGRKKSWPDRDLNPGSLAIREPTELLSQWSSFDRTFIKFASAVYGQHDFRHNLTSDMIVTLTLDVGT